MPALSDATNDFQKSIARAILREVNEQIEKAKEEVIANAETVAAAEFQRRIKRIIGNVAMDISNYYSIQRLGDEILIMVKFEKEER